MIKSLGAPPDHEQRRLIETALDTTMLVEAAAGTGKTTCLISRMVALLAEGRCPIGRMAAVTFTRKATAQLRDRFGLELERAARAAEGPRRARLLDALEHVEQCFIGTIHSFCARLLRERPVEAGVDVGFEELDEKEEYRLREAAWDEYVARAHAGGDPLVGELDALGLELRDLRAAYLGFADYPDVEQWPQAPAALDETLAGRAAEALRGLAAHMEAVAPGLPRHTGGDLLIPFYRELPRRLEYARLGERRELMAILEDFAASKPTLKEWPDPQMAKQEKARWKEFVERFAKPLVEQWHRLRYEPAMKALGAAAALFAEMRRQRGVLSYQDLLMKAAELLRGPPNVRRYFRRRFTHLLVDEFQDTDPVQAQVMMLLTAGDDAQTDWSRCEPRPGSLFVVGDPKQSIYRFRRADIVTYNQVRRIIEACGRVVPLTANFRSIEPVIDWVNGVSATLFPAPTEYSPADRPMDPARPGPAAGGCAGVFALQVPDPPGGSRQSKDDVIAWEAEAIGRIIRDAVDRGLTVPRRGGEPSAVTARDFLILTWTRAPLVAYARRLHEWGLAAEVTGGTAVNDVAEVALLHAVLAALAEPDNPVPLVGVLRSEVFGVSDTELYRFRRGGGRFDLGFGEPVAGGEAVTAALERLRLWADRLKRMQPIAAVETIAGDIGLPARAATAPGGSQRAGSLCKAIDLLRAAQRDHWSIGGLTDWLGRLVDPSSREREKHDGMPLRPQPDAVRVMNLHQAKGLEAPIVFLAEGTGQPPGRRDLHVDRRQGAVRGYLAVRAEQSGWGSGRLLAVPVEWEEMSEQEKRFSDAERDRLLYVAATRAESMLVISRPQRPKWDKLVAGLPRDRVLALPAEVAAPVPARVLLDADQPQAFGHRLAARLHAVRCPTFDVQRVKAVAVRGAKPAGVGEHGTEWGTVIHVLLDAAIARPQADLAALAAAALAEQGLDPGLAAEAMALVRSVTRSPLWQRAARGTQRLTEVPIQFMRQPAAPGEVPVLVRGVIDLVFREPEGWVIVDYKTDDRPGEPVDELVAHYAGQVRMYADAWSRLVEEPVAEAGLFFVRNAAYRVVPHAAGSLAGA